MDVYRQSKDIKFERWFLCRFKLNNSAPDACIGNVKYRKKPIVVGADKN